MLNNLIVLNFIIANLLIKSRYFRRFFMPFSIDKSFIAKRVRMLRNDYTLTTTELAILLGFKRKTSITAIEVGRSVPSYDVLMYIVQLFGVSMDWLMGYSDIQYDEEVLLNVEKICPSIPLMELNIEAIPDDYLNVRLRAEKYTPWARGNIIYFRNLLGNIEYRDTELKNRVYHAKDQLKNLLTSDQHILVYGRTAFEVTCLIPQIIKTGNIVCAGYSSLLTQVLQELGIPATSYTVALEPEQDKVVYHARTLIRLDDEKYNIHGIYTLDSTWDSQKKELSTVTSKEGKEEIRYEREEGDTLIKDYDSLALYRNFLVPYRDYRNLYKTDSKPAIFDEVDYDLGLTEKEPYTDTAEEQRQILFPNETKAIEQKIILDTKKPSLEVFTQALRTVRQKEGYLEDSISDQVNDVVELNQMVETLYDRPQTFFPPQTQK